MFQFLHAADIHLDSPLRGLEAYPDAPLQEIRAATRRAFDNLIDLAIEERVAFVLLCGDLYDGDWKDYNTGLYFAQRMGRLHQAGIRVFVISGNHDAASQITRNLMLPDNVHLFPVNKAGSVELPEYGVALHGQGYASRAVSDNLAASYPQGREGWFNIGLLHTALNGRPGHEPYAPCSLDQLRAKGYQYWALGHVHQPEVVCEQPWVVFPGNIQGRHIRETGSKGCTLVSIADGEVIEVRHRSLDVLRWAQCEVDVSTADSEEEVYGLVRGAFEEHKAQSEGRTLALRLVVRGRTAVHARLQERSSHWNEELRALAATLGDLWLEKVRFATEAATAAGDLLSEDSPFAGLLHSLADLRIEGRNLYSLVPELNELRNRLPAELLSGDDPFDPAAPGQLDELRKDVRELLMARLLHHGRDV
ncbi:metallophosphoesterase family protein [Geoalkalibacter halelectricus]|uniref:DNA repair exonuclease n=1 Tax=Geoalkalibacter halelectricus TaxID=2847045 RepID=A0ABY5ZPM6_9BACT|nr:DNA repair exonuclease [Geoalkalibacter halelectricus]MDO3376877.1 DNA repair exonuclease [Geoalkalibacter halelectricus]UWZ81102.1 DNA repair exonuclease [Geoalkalibacter halelectricus]